MPLIVFESFDGSTPAVEADAPAGARLVDL